MKNLPKLSIIPLFIVTCLTFSLFDCSSSDDDSTDNLQKTFLEKFDSTLWKSESLDWYIYFENSESNALSIYSGIEQGGLDDCYWLTRFEEYDSVYENSENTLVIKSSYVNGNYDLETFTFVDGKMIWDMFEFYEGEISVGVHEFIQILHEPSSLFTVCN